jgi:hypothetical protein
MRSRTRFYALLIAAALLIGVTVGSQSFTREAPRDANGRLYDPIEDDPEAGPLIRKADQEARQAMNDVPRQLGWTRWFFESKKQILKEKYKIEWRSPAEMNPGVAYD